MFDEQARYASNKSQPLNLCHNNLDSLSSYAPLSSYSSIEHAHSPMKYKTPRSRLATRTDRAQASEEGPRPDHRHETRPSIPPRRASQVSSSWFDPQNCYQLSFKLSISHTLPAGRGHNTPIVCQDCTKSVKEAQGIVGWARADGELRAEPPWDRIDRNRGAGRLARRGVRHETRDASGDMRPRDVRQVAAFSPLTSHVSRPAHHLGRSDRAAGQARKARRAGPEPSRQESRMPSIPRSSGARSSPSRWSWWSRWSRAAT